MDMELNVRDARSEDAAALIANNSAMARETEGKTLDPRRIGPGVANVLAGETDGTRLCVVAGVPGSSTLLEVPVGAPAAAAKLTEPFYTIRGTPICAAYDPHAPVGKGLVAIGAEDGTAYVRGCDPGSASRKGHARFPRVGDEDDDIVRRAFARSRRRAMSGRGARRCSENV